MLAVAGTWRQHCLRSRRSLSSYASAFVDLVPATSSRFQLYFSCCDNPFVNLSIENYLLDKSPPDSTVLLFYINRPCVVIGRNQNPWLEVNLSQLRNSYLQQPIELVRRRSGGGTVFHDQGNVNFSIVRPTSEFTRDRLVDMVVRAMQADEPRAAVNERHDIVLRLGGERGTRKVSGSAYKLTRNRALHHATCLVDSPNLKEISKLLKSPGAPYIKARGVDSVPSPISNLFPGSSEQGMERFVRRVANVFSEEHKLGHKLGDMLVELQKQPVVKTFFAGVYGVVNEELASVDHIQEGIRQLKVRSPISSAMQWELTGPAQGTGVALRPDSSIHFRDTPKPFRLSRTEHLS